MLATAALVVVSQSMPDPLAKFRTPDGRLMIPGRALTPELQRLLFHGNDLGPLTNVTFLLPVRSSYPTERLVAISFASPNLNVFVHPRQAPETWGSASITSSEWGSFPSTCPRWGSDFENRSGTALGGFSIPLRW